MGIQARDCPERPLHFTPASGPRSSGQESRVSQLARDVQGSSSPLSGTRQKSESKRKRMSANKGTREARLSRVVTQLSRRNCRPKHLPMRQPSGGAPVVVGDAKDAHVAKGCRMIRSWTTEMFFNLEASG